MLPINTRIGRFTYYMQKLLVISGPTATGKTALALHLAKFFDGELISADSRQIYRGMDIGTGKDLPSGVKPTLSSIQIDSKNAYTFSVYAVNGIPVWMYDVINPDEEFSVSHYQKLASAVIEDIKRRGKLPILIGGTGLYIRSIVSGFDTLTIPPDRALRKIYEHVDISLLQKKLQEDFPHIWENLNGSDRMNPRRLIRKLEIGIHQKQWKKEKKELLNKHDICWISFQAPFSFLYEKIDERVDKRYKEGIIEEIKGLLGKGYRWDLPSMHTLGYQEWRDYFEKNDRQSTSFLIADILQKWKYHEHAYARRQMTWFRKETIIHWFDRNTKRETIESFVAEWYNK